MKIETALSFKGQLCRFFHCVLISVFSNGIDSLLKGKVVDFAQKHINNLNEQCVH